MAQLFNMEREVETMETFHDIVDNELPKGFLQNASLTDVLFRRREPKNRTTKARRNAWAAIDRRVASRTNKGLALLAPGEALVKQTGIQIPNLVEGDSRPGLFGVMQSALGAKEATIKAFHDRVRQVRGLFNRQPVRKVRSRITRG